MVKELLDLYAARQAFEGFRFSSLDQFYREFEATFEYEETPDQVKAIEEVMKDMGNPKPMDRLICGDVGYGKTEVAVRAAYRAVMNGKQVAVLVPTTSSHSATRPFVTAADLPGGDRGVEPIQKPSGTERDPSTIEGRKGGYCHRDSPASAERCELPGFGSRGGR
jgi:hypothetical protein